MLASLTTALALATSLTTAWADPTPGAAAPPASEGGAGNSGAKDGTPRKKNPGEYGPFFEAEAPSDTRYAASISKGKKPFGSVGNGSFCFIDGAWCRASLLISAGVAVGLRVPASDAGPDVPYSQFNVHGGFVVKPLMYAGRKWSPWGLGVVASWSRGTGSVTSNANATEHNDTRSTDATRVAVLNQIWLSKRPHGLHLDLSVGAVRSAVLTSHVPLWGTHAEVGFGIGGWATLFGAADFLDRDTRIMLGLRAHGIAAGPLIALALAGMAIGGAL
jgi:hypothetical protein